MSAFRLPRSSGRIAPIVQAMNGNCGHAKSARRSSINFNTFAS